jgi:quercetin dioxygenase-like cupin family protein
MTVDIRPFPRPDWSPLPYDGCVGVDGKVLVSEDDFFIAMLRFEPDATIHEHPGDNDTVVMCVEGEGYTSVAGDVMPVRAGQQIRWPRGITHRLWTAESPMVTLMYERTDAS